MFTNIDWHIQYLPEKEGKGGEKRKYVVRINIDREYIYVDDIRLGCRDAIIAVSKDSYQTSLREFTDGKSTCLINPGNGACHGLRKENTKFLLLQILLKVHD